MLKKLTHIAKNFRAFPTLVGIIRNPTTSSTASIFEHGSIRHELTHGPLLTSKLINLSARIINATTSGAATRLDVLYGICTGTESAIPTEGARDIAGAMHLRVHVELVLRIERPVAFMALVANGSWHVSAAAVDATAAPGRIVRLAQLIGTKMAPA